MKSYLHQRSLLLRIELKKQEMYRKANVLGFTHPVVVTCSQELDQLLNRYQRKAS
ncbi:aspartyl-phosphate phosphatase Spo0E family protein [Psychrobacillus antarcticus]|uniref:aspartyl-phosphate phosphatase Spo0E family protein n=1 Tax=Psychrobacillus antarcticus TaxID=2879115 RepID=UPI0024086D6A|nr:aspartyl-phosphate phosphatase Spo0E family protein [Psychrobacillus antarcticus]